MRFNSLILKTILYATLVACFSAYSQQSGSPEDGFKDQHIATEQWHLSLSAGIGVITNPLRGGNNIPLVLIPQVAFYAEQWFFDNGRLGYSFVQAPKHHFNFVSELNTESRFFINWHPRNILSLSSSSLSNQVVDEGNSSPSKYANINDVQKRHIAFDVGAAYHYVKNDANVFSIQALHDITSVYNGIHAAMQWQHHTQIGQLKLKQTMGINYKSAELNNYFYGLKAGETQFGKIDVGSSWQPYAKIDARWPLSKANSLRFHLAYYDYSAMDSSPLFERTYSMTAFIGLDHTF
ncbi:MipA/OmpV family protein [Pseudoalteromonas sp. S558]|uniref:MipA/OmpV family protein n=1 Tax=Pseudoalteromonas sp. S558 TaxID=2066515 RepID=UPI00110BA910|nr:MipA/OmpV family protein [Pseudoalteromonas sp. S558]TMO04058.1 structural protein MipA [Pseudoalteromonas sp. S558]